MGLNTFTEGGQLHVCVDMKAGGCKVAITWHSPEEVVRDTARAWSEVAREAVNAGAAASLVVDGILPRDSTRVH